MWTKLQFPADLVTFMEKVLNQKLNFLCSVYFTLILKNLMRILEIIPKENMTIQEKKEPG